MGTPSGIVSAATIVDLTVAGNSGAVGGVTFVQVDPQSTGTGQLDVFSQVQAQGNNSVQSGYNTTVNNTLDGGNPDNFNHSITVGDLPMVTYNGADHRLIILDVNEADQGPAAGRFISLDEIQLFVGGTANSSVETFDGSGVLEHDGTLAYRLDDGMDNWIALDFQLNSGSGSGDMFMYIPETVFAPYADGDVVTLYSQFGLQGDTPGGGFVGDFGASSGFEEWGLPTFVPDRIPEPGSVVLLVGGLLLVAGKITRRA